MLQRLDLSARSIRDRLLARQNRRTGVACINDILTAAGMPRIDNDTYAQWLNQICFDAELSRAYETAKSILIGDEAGRRKYAGGWAEFVRSTMHMTDMFYILVRAVKPEHVIETGVAFGGSSALMLAALVHNNYGRLVSIDLPAYAAMTGHKSGSAIGILVPDDFRCRWDLRQANALEALQPAFAEATPSIFVHDSDHSYRHMMFEYTLAASYMPKGSILISDDTRMNNAFYDFTGAVGAKIVPHGLNDSVACAVL